MAELAAERGYQEVTLEQVSRTARVSNSTFQQLFGGKEEAFLAVLGEAVARAEGAVERALGDQERPWPERIRAGLAALLEAVSAEPELARAFLIESRTAGERAIAIYDDALARLVPPLRQGRALKGAPEDLPVRLEEGIIGGLAWHLSERLSDDRSGSLVELAPDVLVIVLSPYVGEERARELALGSGRSSAAGRS